MPLSAIFQLYRGSQFNWWRKSEYPEKTTNLPQVTDKHHIMLYSCTPRLSGLVLVNYLTQWVTVWRIHVNDLLRGYLNLFVIAYDWF